MSSQNQSRLLHKFKGILFSTMSSEELLNSLDSFNAREDDVFLVSYPKSDYIIRNPEDTAVSLFHYYRENLHLPSIETWAAFLELFLRGDGAVGDWINYFTSKHKRVFDELFTEKMKHCELVRHFEDYF